MIIVAGIICVLGLIFVVPGGLLVLAALIMADSGDKLEGDFEYPDPTPKTFKNDSPPAGIGLG
jgi:hypothetical protein